MNVLFEDDGTLKAGTVLADNDTSLQVEAISGKRITIKSAHVLLRFTSPSAADALTEGQALLRDLDPEFLREASGDDEFGFADLPRDPGLMRTVVREADQNVGIYATVAQPGEIRVGDPVELL